MLSGRVIAMEVAWDSFVSRPDFFNSGTAIIPPPEPKNPLANPVIIPRIQK